MHTVAVYYYYYCNYCYTTYNYSQILSIVLQSPARRAGLGERVV